MTIWNEKDQQQFQRIKESAQARGKAEEEARELAARTVDKNRREEQRTDKTVEQDQPKSNE